jgi:aarF domain-containing kinase
VFVGERVVLLSLLMFVIVCSIGDETSEFVEAHIAAGLVVGEPFEHTGNFDFGNSNLTKRLSSYGGTFMKYRLTPPPTEAYSLHRKLAGAFLLCIKLKANIPCRDILENTYKGYKFGEEAV